MRFFSTGTPKKEPAKIWSDKVEESAMLPMLSTECKTEFSARFEHHASAFQDDDRFSKGLVRYQYLKNHLNTVTKKYGDELETRKLEHLTDECSICLEELGHACDVTTTACNHDFHTICLVETLSQGMCGSCPLCRTEKTAMVIKECAIKGAGFKMLVKLRLNIDAAQDCHKALLKDIESRAAVLRHEAEALRTLKSKLLPPSTSCKKSKLHERVTAVMRELDRLELFNKLNSEGFARICDKISSVWSMKLCEALKVQWIQQRCFYQDFHEDGNGRGRAIRADLQTMLNMTAGSSPMPVEFLQRAARQEVPARREVAA